MFEGSPTWTRLKRERPRPIRLHLGHVPQLDREEGEERRALRLAFAVAAGLNLALLLAPLPRGGELPKVVGSERPVYVVQEVRFEPPPPRQQESLPKPKEKKRVVPIPDPTPEEPEPIRVEELEVPEIDLANAEMAFGIPEGPPGAGVGNPLRLGDGITAPQKIFAPEPRYTEEARLARIQGIVILETVVDASGRVTRVRILKGLSQGLSESAADTVRQWRFKPATLDGEPVPVFLTLTISFSLQ